MSKIGIAISTRNRKSHLKMCLAHFTAYYPEKHDVNILVCDDHSSEDIAEQNKFNCAHWGIDYHYHPSRIGVAANKNFGLSSMMEHDVVFLFDDDCFPNHHEWANVYLDTMNCNNVHHLTYTPWLPRKRTKRDGIYISEWGMGCCMFFSKLLINTIGGLDEKYHLFGFEHLSYARRAFASGMNQTYGAYLTPVAAIDKIFTFDYEYQTLKKQPSLGIIDFEHSRIAYKDTPSSVIKHNRKLFDMNNDEVYVRLHQYKT